MGLCHGRTSALTGQHTDSRRGAGGRTDDHRQHPSRRMTSPLHLVACVTLTLSLLIPGNEAFAIPFNLFLPLDRTLTQRVKAGYRPEVPYKTEYKLQKPSLLRAPLESNLQQLDTKTHQKVSASDKVYLQPRL